MKLYLCRHGETEWTISGQHTGRTDLPLTENGHLQAALLKKKLVGIEFSKVFTSPLKRAVQTSEGMNAEADFDLVEYNYGDYEGLTTAQIRQGDPNWNLFKKGCPHGESLDDVALRADRFLAKLHDVNGNIAIFSHGHFLRILAARFLGLKPEMGKIFSLSVASLSILGYEKNEPVITLWNGV